MRTIEIQVFKFDELNDRAKQSARDWWHRVADYAWDSEAEGSIFTFCSHFGVKLKEYDVEHLTFKHDASNDTFRGRKLKDFKRDHTPTGYCLDYALWETFYDEFKRTTSAAVAFDNALRAGLREWRSDREHQLTDEYADEMLIANEYEFTKEGKIV